jgi:hypothetical protein
MKQARILAVTCLALAAVASACSSSGGAKSPDKATYLKQVNAICKTGGAKLQAVSKDVGGPDQVKSDKEVKEQVVPLIHSQINDMRAVGYPKGDKDKLSKLYDQMDGVANTWEKDPSKVNDSSLTAPTNKQLTAYGLTDCGGS